MWRPVELAVLATGMPNCMPVGVMMGIPCMGAWYAGWGLTCPGGAGTMMVGAGPAGGWAWLVCSTRGWQRLLLGWTEDNTEEGLEVRETGWLSLEDRPTAPMTPTGR